MAEWKKIITSGSLAEISQITASTGIQAASADINGGTLDNVVIGGGTAAAASVTSLDVANGNITNVGDIDADSISIADAGVGLNINFGGNTTKNLISLTDNLADALNITQASNSYIKFITSNSSEKILVSKDVEFLGDISGSVNSTGSLGHINVIGTGSFGGIETAGKITANEISLPNDSIPIAQLVSDAITIAGTSTALGGSITADTIAGQISADTISGNQINGGTIGSITISALAGALSLGDNNITNVGDINCDSISVDAAGTGLDIVFGGNTTTNKITLTDNLADALNITEGSNSYIKFTTTNSSEKILVSQDTEFLGDVSGSATSTGSFGKLLGDGSDLTGVSTDIDGLDAFSGVPHATDDQFLISDDGTELRATMTMVANGAFALVSGDATIAAGGALTIANNSVEEAMVANNAIGNDQMADNAIGNSELKQDDDISLQSLTTTNNVTVGGDLVVNGTTTTIATTNTEVKDQFLLLASGSSGTNVDAGIIVQSGSVAGTGSAFYHDISEERWAVGKSLEGSRTAATTHTQFVTTVKTSTSTPSATDGDYGIGEMWVDTDDSEPTGDGVVYIRTA